MEHLFNIKDKVVVITGGTGVLGAAMAKGLARLGAKLVVIGRSVEKIDLLVEEVRRDQGTIVGIQADVLDKESLFRAKDAILKEYGTMDVLINGAGGNRKGATTSADLSFFDLPEAELDQVFKLNVLGSILPSQVFGEVMRNKNKGVILNVSSMAAIQPLTNVVGYGAAKAAINNLTQWLSVHMNLNYSPQIRVNAIAPGFFLTEQNRFLLTEEKDGSLTKRGQTILAHTPMGRYGEPNDLLGTIVWLISDASSFVTGIVVPVDGGFSAFSGV